MHPKNIIPPFVIKKVIVHYFTQRQTCNRCELLIQRSAHNCKYVPLISFNELFLREEGNEIEDEFCDFHGEKKYYLPYSKCFYNDLIPLKFLTIPKKPISLG